MTWDEFVEMWLEWAGERTDFPITENNAKRLVSQVLTGNMKMFERETIPKYIHDYFVELLMVASKELEEDLPSKFSSFSAMEIWTTFSSAEEPAMKSLYHTLMGVLHDIESYLNDEDDADVVEGYTYLLIHHPERQPYVVPPPALANGAKTDEGGKSTEAVVADIPKPNPMFI